VFQIEIFATNPIFCQKSKFVKNPNLFNQRFFLKIFSKHLKENVNRTHQSVSCVIRVTLGVSRSSTWNKSRITRYKAFIFIINRHKVGWVGVLRLRCWNVNAYIRVSSVAIFAIFKVFRIPRKIAVWFDFFRFPFWPKFHSLTKTSFFDQNFIFWPKFNFLTKM